MTLPNNSYPWESWRLWHKCLTALIAGALTPLALAPLNIWPLALISPAVLMLLLYRQGPTNIFRLSWAFGVGLFGVGISWVYVSIHDFGYTGVPLAAFLTSLFVIGLGLIFSLPFLLLALRQPQTRSLFSHLLATAALWVLGEWIRSWFLTGLPWLYIGYSQINTPIAGWAPVLGIFGLSLILALSTAFILWAALERTKRSILISVIFLCSFWGSGAYLTAVEWTQSTGNQYQVALIQANIAQEKKWRPEHLATTLRRYERMTKQATSADWVIWPEAAIPLVYHRALPVLSKTHETALNNNRALITGILYDNPNGEYHNSITGLGLATGLYHKTRLVPFGEYIPLESLLRSTLDFFNLPVSTIRPGKPNQTPLQIGSERIASAICYEVVYPDLVAENAKDSNIILTISNDAWFGGSWGPLQHLQMAQMRALETGRYVIRSTNNGVSAIINTDGELVERSDQFVQQVLKGNVQTYQGSTPFMRWGSLPVLLLSFGLLLLGINRVSRIL